MMKWAREETLRTLRVIVFILSLGILFLIAPPSWGDEKETFWVDRFKSLGSDGLPEGWVLEKEPGKQSKIALVKEQENTFLHLLSAGDAFGLKKEISFDIRKYPHLSWRWKVTQLPPKGDIRKREADDQAGQIYVVFPRFPARVNSRSMGYIWDTLAPVGLAGTSTTYSRMKYVVLQSGPEKLGQWLQESRNVYEDYKKAFQEEPPQVGALLLYINTQHINGSAECFYDDLFFSAKAPKK